MPNSSANRSASRICPSPTRRVSRRSRRRLRTLAARSRVGRIPSGSRSNGEHLFDFFGRYAVRVDLLEVQVVPIDHCDDVSNPLQTRHDYNITTVMTSRHLKAFAFVLLLGDFEVPADDGVVASSLVFE